MLWTTQAWCYITKFPFALLNLADNSSPIIQLMSEVNCMVLLNILSWLPFHFIRASCQLNGVNGAETNSGIAHILGILLRSSCDTVMILATSIICSLSTLNYNAMTM